MYSTNMGSGSTCTVYVHVKLESGSTCTVCVHAKWKSKLSHTGSAGP